MLRYRYATVPQWARSDSNRELLPYERRILPLKYRPIERVVGIEPTLDLLVEKARRLAVRPHPLSEVDRTRTCNLLIKSQLRFRCVTTSQTLGGNRTRAIPA